jgi:hypothetical protein|eukprot:COSAG01_NODE_3743_length_5743_cov_10.259568_7_plen_100_part_00
MRALRDLKHCRGSPLTFDRSHCVCIGSRAREGRGRVGAQRCLRIGPPPSSPVLLPHFVVNREVTVAGLRPRAEVLIILPLPALARHRTHALRQRAMMEG